jgi:hypothetical protein
MIRRRTSAWYLCGCTAKGNLRCHEKRIALALFVNLDTCILQPSRLTINMRCACANDVCVMAEGTKQGNFSFFSLFCGIVCGTTAQMGHTKYAFGQPRASGYSEYLLIAKNTFSPTLLFHFIWLVQQKPKRDL